MENNQIASEVRFEKWLALGYAVATQYMNYYRESTKDGGDFRASITHAITAETDIYSKIIGCLSEDSSQGFKFGLFLSRYLNKNGVWNVSEESRNYTSKHINLAEFVKMAGITNRPWVANAELLTNEAVGYLAIERYLQSFHARSLGEDLLLSAIKHQAKADMFKHLPTVFSTVATGACKKETDVYRLVSTLYASCFKGAYNMTPQGIAQRFSGKSMAELLHERLGLTFDNDGNLGTAWVKWCCITAYMAEECFGLKSLNVETFTPAVNDLWFVHKTPVKNLSSRVDCPLGSLPSVQTGYSFSTIRGRSLDIAPSYTLGGMTIEQYLRSVNGRPLTSLFQLYLGKEIHNVAEITW